MARDLDIGTLLALKQQQSSGMEPMGMAMKLLGLGQQEGREGTSEERESRAQQAQQAYYEGLIGQQKAQSATELEKLGITKSEAAAQAADRLEAAKLRNLQQQELEGARTRDIRYKEDALAAETLKEIMGSPDFTKEEKRAAAMKVNPRVAAGIQEEMAAKKAIATGKFKKGLEQTYKTAGEKGRPGDVAAYLKTQEAIPGIEEIMQDPSIRWQELNAGMPAAQPGLLSRMFGGGGGAGTPTVAAPLPEARRPEDYVPEWQQVGPVAGEYQPGASFPRQGREAIPPPVDKVMEIAGVTGRNAAPPFVYEPGGPSAMPGVVQQPGFLENFLRQISEYAGSRPERTPTERYPYPIGHGVPPTSAIDPRLLQ